MKYVGISKGTPICSILNLHQSDARHLRVGGYEVFDHSYDAVVIGAGGAGHEGVHGVNGYLLVK